MYTRRTQKLIDKSNERFRMLEEVRGATVKAPSTQSQERYRISWNDWQGHRDTALAAITEESGLR